MALKRQKIAGWIDPPYDIFWLLEAFLSPIELRAMRSVCQSWRQVVNSVINRLKPKHEDYLLVRLRLDCILIHHSDRLENEDNRKHDHVLFSKSAKSLQSFLALLKADHSTP